MGFAAATLAAHLLTRTVGRPGFRDDHAVAGSPDGGLVELVARMARRRALDQREKSLAIDALDVPRGFTTLVWTNRAISGECRLVVPGTAALRWFLTEVTLV